ncbi:unnamed protein product, partial [Amoebophrya sp. A25]
AAITTRSRRRVLLYLTQKDRRTAEVGGQAEKGREFICVDGNRQLRFLCVTSFFAYLLRSGGHFLVLTTWHEEEKSTSELGSSSFNILRVSVSSSFIPYNAAVSSPASFLVFAYLRAILFASHEPFFDCTRPGVHFCLQVSTRKHHTSESTDDRRGSIQTADESPLISLADVTGDSLWSKTACCEETLLEKT